MKRTRSSRDRTSDEIRHVLLVDDNRDLRQTTRELLEALGYEVTSAASVAEAETAYQQGGGGIDAVISDVDMPGASGVELADHLQATNPRLPVLLISSRQQDPSVDQRVRTGRLSFLPKPFSGDQLATAMNNLVRPAADEEDACHIRRGGKARHARVAAALAILLIGGLWITMRSEPPALPRPPGEGGVQRGATIEVALQGPVAEAPHALPFHEVSGAVAYRLSLRKVDETLLWQDNVPGAPAPLPDGVVQQLLPGVTYCWQVEALDHLGARLAWSPQTCFNLAASTAADHPVPPATKSGED